MAPGAVGGAMARPEDVSGALRAVWEVRQGEERLEWCMGGWYNLVFGLMTASIFATYGALWALGLQSSPVARFAWAPPVIAAYTAIAFATKNVLGLSKPTFQWRSIALGTFAFVVLFALLGLAYGTGVVRDYAAGVSIVIGAFYVGMGIALREAGPGVFGGAIAAGAAALLLLDLGPWASTLYGIFVTAGGMVATGVWMLRGPGRAPPGQGGDRGPSELDEVRETLEALRGHEHRVQARERAARYLFAASILALAAVAGLTTGSYPAPLVLLAFAGLCAAFGAWHQRAGRAHA